ncbi:MAG: hypothetical protein L0Y79_04540 [Chlorobi bacterium]|nr:hypothetical protein [Chlorobiota bacterium]MCI0717058.1 hypothetical protein [Chlorobiota bacterium]
MLAAIYDTENNYWDKILNQEGDVELEDEETEEEEEDENKGREKTPDLKEDIFKDDDNIAIAECF